MTKSNKLFKVVILVLAFITVFACSSCKVKSKTFTKLEMSIELTDEFYEKSHISYTVYYESKDQLVVALREDFSLLGGGSTWTTMKYASACISANGLTDTYPKTSTNGEYSYFTYDKTLNGQDYSYLATCHKSDSAFWLIQFASFTSDFEEFLSQFFEYADSITFE